MQIDHIYNFNAHPHTEGESSTNPRQVLEALINALNPSSHVNKEALEMIQRWEADATRGFLTSLTEIIQHKQISEEIRLAAAILAKNTIGNSWRKSVDTREWIRISDDEKQHIRNVLLTILLHEESEKIVQQIVLLIANIARFDVPQKWPNLIDELLQIISADNSQLIYNRYKAVLSLKQVLFALQTKVTVSEGLSMASVKLAVEEAKMMPKLIEVMIPRIATEIDRYLAAFRVGDNNYSFNGKITKLLFTSLAIAIKLVPNLNTVANIKSIYENLYMYSNSIFQLLIQSIQYNCTDFPLDYLKCQSDLFFKIINCITISLETHTYQFHEYLVPFVKHYTSTFLSITSFDQPLNHRVISHLFPHQKIMKITYLLTRVLCAPQMQEHYWPSNLQNYPHPFGSFFPSLSSPTSFLNEDRELPKTKEVFDQLSQFFTSNDMMATLISTILSKYMSLTKEELEDWENDPESFIKEIEAHDTLRQSSEELLVALSIYNPALVEEIITNYLERIKALPSSSFSTLNENVLNLDACYKSIALISFAVPRSKERSAIQDINFWYSSELKSRIENPNFNSFSEKLLLFRALWILRKLGFKMEDCNRVDLLKSPGLLKCLYSSDIVICLQSIITIHSILTSHKEYSELRELFHRDDKKKDGDLTPFSDKFPQFKPTYLPTTQQFPIGDFINGSLILLPKLTETESKLRILNLILNLINVIGNEEIISNISVIIQHFPLLWENLSVQNKEETGSEVILKKELITLTSNLVTIAGPSLYNIPSLFDISITTLKQSIDFDLLANAPQLPKSYQIMTVEEGLVLWISLIRNSPTLPQPLFDLLFFLLKLIRSDIETVSCLQLLEAYVLLGGTSLMSSFAIPIFDTLHSIITTASNREYILNALYCVDTILRMFPSEGAILFKPTIQFLAGTLFENSMDEKGEKSLHFSREIIHKFAQIIARVIVQNQSQISELLVPPNTFQAISYLNHILFVLLGEIQIHSMNELFSLMLTISASRNRKILSLAILMLLIHLRDAPVIDYFAQSLSCIFDVMNQLRDIEERKKRYFQQLNRSKNILSKIDEIYFEITENDPLVSLDIVPYFTQACHIFISRFGNEKFLSLFDEEQRLQISKLLSEANEDSLSLTSLTV